MNKHLQSIDDTPRTVAFGRSWNSFFIVFEDGGYVYQNIPSALRKYIRKHNDYHGPALTQVSRGPKGEWFVETEDGNRGWGSLSAQCHHHLEQYEQFEHVYVHYLAFGDNDQYFVKWYCFEDDEEEDERYLSPRCKVEDSRALMN
jgi:hypothetical protein